MKKYLILFSIFIFAFTNKVEEKTAQLKFTQAQYNAIKTNFIDANNRMDSIRIALKVMGVGNQKVDEMLSIIQNEIVANANFIFQIDSVFKK